MNLERLLRKMMVQLNLSSNASKVILKTLTCASLDVKLLKQ